MPTNVMSNSLTILFKELYLIILIKNIKHSEFFWSFNRKKLSLHSENLNNVRILGFKNLNNVRIKAFKNLKNVEMLI